MSFLRPDTDAAVAHAEREGDRRASPNTPTAMSAALVTTGRAMTREIIGDAAYARGLGSVPAEIAAEYSRATSVGWVPLSVVEPVIVAMGEAAHRDYLDLQDEVARATIERSLRSIWRVFLRVTTNEAIISRVPIIYSKSYNKGRIVVSFPRPDRAVVELCDWPNAPAHIVRTTRVGIEVTLRAAGRPAAHVSLERSPGGAIYVAGGLR